MTLGLEGVGVTVQDAKSLVTVSAGVSVEATSGSIPDIESEVLMSMDSSAMEVSLGATKLVSRPTADAEAGPDIRRGRSVVLESCRIKVDSENVVVNVPEIETTPNVSVAGSTSISVVIMTVFGMVAIVAPTASPSRIPIVLEGETTIVSRSRAQRVV